MFDAALGQGRLGGFLNKNMSGFVFTYSNLYLIPMLPFCQTRDGNVSECEEQAEPPKTAFGTHTHRALRTFFFGSGGTSGAQAAFLVCSQHTCCRGLVLVSACSWLLSSSPGVSWQWLIAISRWEMWCLGMELPPTLRHDLGNGEHPEKEREWP